MNDLLTIYFIDEAQTKGYRVQKVKSRYTIMFVTKDSSGKEITRVAYNRGYAHSYLDMNTAEHVIQNNILPLYQTA